MKKILFFALCCFILSAISVNAQETSDVRESEVVVDCNPLLTNWFVQGGVGIVYFDGDFARYLEFGDKITPTFELSVGKWVTPTIGFRAGFKGLTLATKSNYQTDYSVGSSTDSYGQFTEKYEVTNLHVDAMVNLSNAILGYKEDQFYNCIPYVGFGVMQRFTSITDNDLAATVGLLNSFYISSALDVYLDLTYTSFKDEFSYLGTTTDFTFAASVGLTYKFKKRGWENCPVTYTGISEEDFARINDQLAAEKAKNAALAEDLSDQKVLTAAKAAEATANAAEIVDQTAQLLVTFKIASTSIDNLSRVNLEYYANTIKASKDSDEFVLTGYADNKTGSSKVNDRISKQRAEAVYNALVDEYGVDASKLSIEFKGGVDNMFFDDVTLSRSVILQPAQ